MSADTQPDPGGAASAINRYRDIAKWLITAFAAVGALLAAGSQLSSLGKLDLEDHWLRLLAAVAGLALALAMTFVIIHRALKILAPIEMSLEALLADTPLRQEIEATPSLLPLGAADVAGVRAELQVSEDDPTRSADEKRVVRDAVGALLEDAAFRRARRTFDDAWHRMAKAAALAAAGILVFAWAANPPKDAKKKEPAELLSPRPQLVRIELTNEGRDVLDGALGKECVAGEPRALVVGGTEETPKLAVLPESGCRGAQFVLDGDVGKVRLVGAGG